MRSDSPADASVTWALGLIVALLGALTCLPLYGGHWWHSHEGWSYPIRTAEYLRVLHAGHTYPRWCPDLYYGYGSPFFNFYAPGVYTAAALFVGLGWEVVPALKMVVVLAGAAGAFGAFALVREETGRDDAALLAGAAFAFMPYRFTDIITRGDLAEFAALSLLLFPIWLYRAMTRAAPARLVRLGAAAALTHAGVIFTHTLIGLWGTELLVLLLLPEAIRLWRARERRRLATVAVAFTAALALSAIYAAPALLEKGYVKIEAMTRGHYDTFNNFPDPGLLFYPGFYFVGEALLGLGLVALVYSFRPPKRAALADAYRWWLAVLVFLGLMMEGSEPLWRLLPFARFMQFPWRLLGLVAVCGAPAIGVTYAVAVPGDARGRLTLAAGLAALVGVTSLRFPEFVGWIPATQIPNINSFGGSLTAADEYVPVGVKQMPNRIAANVQPIGKGVHVQAAQHHGVGYRIQATATAPGILELHHFWFPGWFARERSGAPVELEASSNGLIRLRLPEPGTYDVVVDFGSTPVRTAASATSALALALLLPALWAVRPQRQVV
jgi:hypothetical protein